MPTPAQADWNNQRRIRRGRQGVQITVRVGAVTKMQLMRAAAISQLSMSELVESLIEKHLQQAEGQDVSSS